MRATARLLILLVIAGQPLQLSAADYFGQVTFNGLPVPGATVTFRLKAEATGERNELKAEATELQRAGPESQEAPGSRRATTNQEQYAETAQPLVAFAAFYRDGAKVFEAQPVVATKQLDRTSKAVPIRFSVPIDRIPPGRYECQVTVVDPAGQKAAFWQAPIAIVP